MGSLATWGEGDCRGKHSVGIRQRKPDRNVFRDDVIQRLR